MSIDSPDHGKKREASFERVYEDLQRIARGMFANERTAHTLQPTALVHEAYLRLTASGAFAGLKESELLVPAITMMRRVLVDHARRRNTEMRGGKWKRSVIDLASGTGFDSAREWLEIDDALTALERVNTRAYNVFTFRTLGGCSLARTADMMGISETTAKSDFSYARAFLAAEQLGDSERYTDGH